MFEDWNVFIWNIFIPFIKMNLEKLNFDEKNLNIDVEFTLTHSWALNFSVS